MVSILFTPAITQFKTQHKKPIPTIQLFLSTSDENLPISIHLVTIKKQEKSRCMIVERKLELKVAMLIMKNICNGPKS